MGQLSFKSDKGRIGRDRICSSVQKNIENGKLILIPYIKGSF